MRVHIHNVEQPPHETLSLFMVGKAGMQGSEMGLKYVAGLVRLRSIVAYLHGVSTCRV